MKREGEVVSSWYWSASTNVNNTSNAWNVNFNNGNVNNNDKNNNNYVRAVRSGKCELLSQASVYRAYLDCRRRKRGTMNALKFEFSLPDRLFDLALYLQNGTYQPTRSVCFVTTKPKFREIFAADFRDRVVHHLVVRELEKIWEPRFIYDSYASRPDKGIHAAVRRLRTFIGQVTRNGKRPAWYLQLDIRSFFMSIDKDVLFAILQKSLKRLDCEVEAVLNWLLQTIIFHDCTKNFSLKGRPGLLEQVPVHKSLFHAPPGKGLPIGNLTSQFFANVYLNELDQFVKRRLKCRHYLRYVDDFVLLAEDPAQLEGWRVEIEDFLSTRLALQLKENARLRRISAGIDFLGYITRRSYVLVRNRVVGNLKGRLAIFKERLVEELLIGGRRILNFRFDQEAITELQQVLASYFGHFKHADSYRLVQKLFQRQSWLGEYFTMEEGRLARRHHPRKMPRSLVGQVRFFSGSLGHVLPLFRVGKFFELYDTAATTAAQRLGLKVVAQTRRGFHSVAGFPFWRLGSYVRMALAAGMAVAVVEQAEKEGPLGVARRYLSEIYKPIWLDHNGRAAFS